MKITTKQIKQLIKEELQNLYEGYWDYDDDSEEESSEEEREPAAWAVIEGLNGILEQAPYIAGTKGYVMGEGKCKTIMALGSDNIIQYPHTLPIENITLFSEYQDEIDAGDYPVDSDNRLDTPTPFVKGTPATSSFGMLQSCFRDFENYKSTMLKILTELADKHGCTLDVTILENKENKHTINASDITGLNFIRVGKNRSFYIREPNPMDTGDY